VEAVFDEGCITANGSSLPVAEMELELKSGDVQPLYS
jgi:inorganic triphosphatase YgiF